MYLLFAKLPANEVFSFLLWFASGFVAKAQWQVTYEDYYPEKELLSRLQVAKTPAEKISAAGFLAAHYKRLFRDSIAAIYLQKIRTIARETNDVNLKADALWWDAYSSAVYTAYDEYDLGTTKANGLLAFARKHNLPEKEIAAYLLLCDLNLHANLALAEQNGLTAKELLDNWRVDSTRKDSLKLEINFRLSHIYIHKKDGVNIARYLLPIHDYAGQNKNEQRNHQAIWKLAYLYGEWTGQNEKAIFWRKKVSDLCLKTNQHSVLLIHYRRLANSYRRGGNKEAAARYHKEADKIRDSLQIYTLHAFLDLLVREKAGMISSEHVLSLLNSNFNNRLFLPPAFVYKRKAYLFLQNGLVDSAGFYLAKAETGKDSLGKHFQGDFSYLQGWYFFLKKEYGKAIKAYNGALQEAEQKGDRDDMLQALLRLHQTYQATNDYKTAHAYLDRYYRFKDSLNSLNFKEEIALMEIEKQRQLQDAAYKEKQATLAREQTTINYQNKIRLLFLITGLAVLLGVAALLYRNNLRKQKINALLQQKNNEIDQQRSKAEEALEDLKATQAQLIQKEKMASLGELTAGIAHEIQNPLNFVNNFSEVSKELAEEMQQELARGNSADAAALAGDVLANLDKVVHHGRRADSIVKGMLQHSRTATGKKELTDINALVDEYLRLAYHGYRAKDQFFHADFRTSYDPSAGKVGVVPQDIGRVLLNLFNNAFYAVAEKSKRLNGNYEPEVLVSTERKNGHVQICVKDNGTGISERAVDKIFQPFFTTKPTGEGTGLGLSLSYDIIKAHGGEMNVESEDGEGATFLIRIPGIE